MKRTREDIAPILDELKARLVALLGDKLDSIILYGSYARGDADEDSDIDVMVILKRKPSSELKKKIRHIASHILLDTLYVISMTIRWTKLAKMDTNLHINIRDEGILLWARKRASGHFWTKLKEASR